MGEISFKSIPQNYEKEVSGRKPNTLRTKVSYLEHLVGVGSPSSIKIINSVSGEFFTRTITDITFWQEWVIISWKHE